jgi:hypothetical protein
MLVLSRLRNRLPADDSSSNSLGAFPLAIVRRCILSPLLSTYLPPEMSKIYCHISQTHMGSYKYSKCVNPSSDIAAENMSLESVLLARCAPVET